MKYIYIFVLLLSTACAHKNSPSSPNDSDQVEQLRAKYDGWQKELKAKADPNTGWFSADCDGMVWEGEAVASGFPGQLVLAELEGGIAGRRAAVFGNCYPVESDTESSPDMRIGDMLGLWETKDLQGLERLEIYASANDWIAGKPRNDLANLWRPTELGLLYRMLSSLGDDVDAKGKDKIGVSCLPVLGDYELHIQTLGIYADGDVSGAISDFCIQALKSNVDQSPSDAVFQSVYGVYTGDLDHAFKLLLDPDYHCPSYVRSGKKYPDAAQVYCTVHKAFAAKVVLKRYEK